ncbi:gamma-glutamylcyclotransferase family protein [Desulfosporosinus shakirovi]|uniref:gamma-glutamylcyclotransferase family protein n=1 Tax=Desulfosporosinus shakirovi TaxID=2885154 RepID=UPI001E45E6A3|nr:gamma-glutamylcyclotransferase family protein [Desulfosporosinus sp. SRJS8]
MKKVTHCYFAYGSNLNWAQMKQRCSSPKVLGVARLPGYKVEFYGYSAVWDGAQETVVPELQSEVWGVLYELQVFDWESLDVYEDARLNGTGAYFHYPVKVVDMKQETINAIIYKKDILKEAKLPSTEYLDFIVQGGKEQGLPTEYLTLLQNRETKPASYAVPILKNSRSNWVSKTGADCGP